MADATESLTALAALLTECGRRTACLIIEPSVQGAAGMRLQPPGFVREVARLCRAHDVHLVLDEVFVAFGRLGSMLVCGNEGVTPDFLCLAKGLSAGYVPLAATLVRDEIFDVFLGTYESRRAFFHGHTYTGNPLAAAVALENIRKLRRLIEGGVLPARTATFGRLLADAFAGNPNVLELRQRGFAAALDLAPPARGAHSPPARVGLQACLRARAHGLLIRPLDNSLLLVPPLCLTDGELGELVRRTSAAIADVYSL